MIQDAHANELIVKPGGDIEYCANCNATELLELLMEAGNQLTDLSDSKNLVSRIDVLVKKATGKE